jgi:hypothetical protein
MRHVCQEISLELLPIVARLQAFHHSKQGLGLLFMISNASSGVSVIFCLARTLLMVPPIGSGGINEWQVWKNLVEMDFAMIFALSHFQKTEQLFPHLEQNPIYNKSHTHKNAPAFCWPEIMHPRLWQKYPRQSHTLSLRL